MTDNLLKQIAPFGPIFHLGPEVTKVERREDGRFNLATSNGTRYINTYPGKKKQILSGFHEAALVAFDAAAYIFWTKKSICSTS